MDYKQEIQKLVKEIKEQGYENICFMQPAYNIGGGPLIEVNIAKYLVKHTDLNVYFCDFENGYATNLLQDTPEVKILTYNEKDILFPIQKKSIIFTNSTRAILLKQMHPENKLIFWHYETINCGWNSVFINHEAAKYLSLLKKENAICYHDWSGKDSLNRFQNVGLTNKDYLYITLDKKNKECSKNLIDENNINIAFLSRLALDKIQSLFYLIKNFADYKTDKKKRLHIIGDGRSRRIVENFCKNYENEIEFIFTGTINREKLDDYLINNVDILFGVGTCILESAALKMPSVMLLIGSKRFEDEDAIWLYNSKEYCVGILQKEKFDFAQPLTPISKILDSVYIENNKAAEGLKCYEYFIKNHTNYDELILNFLQMLINDTLTFDKLKRTIKFVPYNLLKIFQYRLFKINIIKRIEFCDKVWVYFLNLRIFKRRKDKGKYKYYLFGIKFFEKLEKIPYKFPTTSFDDRKQYLNK